MPAKDKRPARLGQIPRCIWLTGLPGAGKTTITNGLEQRLRHAGRHTCVLDGDKLRGGLNADLGFDEADRAENIRRVGEVAHLMVDAGLIVLVSVVSPFRAGRQLARKRFMLGEFIEVFVDTPLAECERRDPKGMYARARRGEIKLFTGVESPYERPADPDIRVVTEGMSIADCVTYVYERLPDFSPA